MRELVEHTEGINRLMARFGVKFGIYKNGEFHEQLFPFDAIPRVITGEEFRILEKGLIQRVDALNLFLKDIYGEKKIIKDQVVPEELYLFLPAIFRNVRGSARQRESTVIFRELIWCLAKTESGTSWKIISGFLPVPPTP